MEIKDHRCSSFAASQMKDSWSSFWSFTRSPENKPTSAPRKTPVRESSTSEPRTAPNIGAERRSRSSTCGPIRVAAVSTHLPGEGSW
ncbi:hypothetical protein KOW79_017928 [Hemibagrus wyckioides]|uniref:Uncharacterized protein n=1 Tax=Hemibagrus wyckioides TaxID=337641 RepID=A0A9D3N894_9TELE|nr:hypothetical protein KOW79_017928 [Hemibagrus wyckioides]